MISNYGVGASEITKYLIPKKGNINKHCYNHFKENVGIKVGDLLKTKYICTDINKDIDQSFFFLFIHLKTKKNKH